MRSGKIVLATAAVILVGPLGNAMAAETTSNVTGSAGSELTLSVATPAALTFTHATPGTTSSVVDVVSTNTSWTLTIHDANADAQGTAGHLDRYTACSAGTFDNDTLTNPLQWNVNGGSYSNLSGTPATVTTGSLVGAPVVAFRQALATGESVATGGCYKLTATYTVT